MFRTGFLSIIRSLVLYTQLYVFVIQVMLTAVSITCMTYEYSYFAFYFANPMKLADFLYLSKVWFTVPYGSVFSEATLSGERTDHYLTCEQFKTLNDYANSPKYKGCVSSMNASTYKKCLILHNTRK